MDKFEIYRLWRYPVMAAPAMSGIDNRVISEKPQKTGMIFKARTEKEAMNKANKFWQKGQFGMGRIFVKLDS